MISYTPIDYRNKASHKMNKRTPMAAGLLLSAVLCTQLASCSSFIVIHGDPAEQTTETTDTAPLTETAPVTGDGGDAVTEYTHVTETEAAPVLPIETARTALNALRDADLDGMNYLIATVNDAAAFGDRFDGDEAGSEVIPETRVERTRMVEEKYNVRIISFSYETEELYKQISAAHLSSDIQYVADFYAIPASEVGRYQAGGMLFNLRSLPFTDYQKSYFDKNAMNAMSAGYGIWAAAGDYTFSPENYYAVYYNKSLYEELALNDPYRAVDSGDWTWEMFLTHARDARNLLDRDGNKTYFGDNLASLSPERAEELFLISADAHPVSAGLDRTPTLSSDPVALDSLVKTVRDAYVSSSSSPAKGDYTDALPDDRSMFLDGKMLYYVGEVAHVKHWADTEVNWGILPLPKADRAQKKYRTYAGDAAVLCVPSTLASPEATGTILQGLFAASAGTYPDVYLDEALSYYVRDGRSVDMLERITSNVGYDFSVSFSGGYPYLDYATSYGFHYAVTNNTAYSSMHNNYKATATQELAKAFGIR